MKILFIFVHFSQLAFSSNLQVSKQQAMDRLGKMSVVEINQIQEEIKLRGIKEWEEFTEAENYVISDNLETCVTQCRKKNVGAIKNVIQGVGKMFGIGSYESLKKKSKAKILCADCVKMVPLKKFKLHNINLDNVSDDSLLPEPIPDTSKNNVTSPGSRSSFQRSPKCGIPCEFDASGARYPCNLYNFNDPNYFNHDSFFETKTEYPWNVLIYKNNILSCSGVLLFGNNKFRIVTTKGCADGTGLSLRLGGTRDKRSFSVFGVSNVSIQSSKDLGGLTVITPSKINFPKNADEGLELINPKIDAGKQFIGSLVRPVCTDFEQGSATKFILGSATGSKEFSCNDQSCIRNQQFSPLSLNQHYSSASRYLGSWMVAKTSRNQYSIAAMQNSSNTFQYLDEDMIRNIFK